MASRDPRSAREAYLDTLPADEQARVLRQSEKVGPLPNDSDWLVAHASAQAAIRIEAAVTAFEARLELASKKTSRDAPRVAVRDRGPARDLFAFAASLAAFAGVAAFVARSPERMQSVVVYALAIALGVAASALYVWLTRRSPRV